MSVQLELLKETEKKTWALAPWLLRPPTISQYKENPAKWAGDVIMHGIYSLTFPLAFMRSYYGGDTFVYRTDPSLPSKGYQNRIHMENDFKNSLIASSLGNIKVEGEMVKIIGTFRKAGNTITFYPLLEPIE